MELALFFFAFAVTAFGSVAYFAIVSPGFSARVLGLEMGKPRQIFMQRLTGALIFGILPLLIIRLIDAESIGDFGWNFPGSATFYWTMLLAAVVVPINYFNSSKASNLKFYPQIREWNWSVRLLIQSAVSWIIYLTAYEFLFRGFLFFASLGIMGLWPAVLLNTAIYSLVHYPKGHTEMLGAIPLGIVLCYLTFLTGNIWVAVFTHVILALSNEWFSIRKHPEMVIKNVWK
ncbi:MAG TPA: CPBP family intramembrane metalloprotease [Lentimicrobium sp.]|jgi:membrane protease YdiL (CAAX protease family)|nr:CPBP family intramembrane metalloprotease [Lentimicrobium sp.]